MGKFPYDKDMTGIAQNLRHQAPPEEKQLWYHFLREYPVQFRRQKPLGRYVLDFYCAKARLGIELDGSQHFTPEGLLSDQNRTAYLNNQGIHILRFSNSEINTQFEAVCRMIDLTVKDRIKR